MDLICRVIGHKPAPGRIRLDAFDFSQSGSCRWCGTAIACSDGDWIVEDEASLQRAVARPAWMLAPLAGAAALLLLLFGAPTVSAHREVTAQLPPAAAAPGSARPSAEALAARMLDSDQLSGGVASGTND